MKKETKISIIVVLANVITMALIIFFNVRIVFDVTSSQTEKIGSIQMENISAKLEETFNAAEKNAINVAYEVDLKMASGATESDLETYFTEKKESMTKDGNCINVYAAGETWYVIPGFTAPEGFDATERLWYVGALKKEGVYITQPYLDLASDTVCFTVSKVLSDKTTVIALDFNLNSVQSYMKQMSSSGTAIIVAESGEIAGYNDASLLGTNIAKTLPQFADIFELEKNNQNSVTITRKVNGVSQTIFCGKTSNNWYLILCVENTALYSESYQQLTWICIVNCALIIAILVLYGVTRRSQLKTQKQLKARIDATNAVQETLIDEVDRLAGYAQQPDGEEKTRFINASTSRIRDTVTKMKDVVEHETVTNAKAVKKEHKLAITNRRIRATVVSIIFAAMCISVTLVATSNYNLGKEKMQEEASHYQSELTDWVTEQKTTLGMFVSAISANPSILNDYDVAVKYLDDITKNYADISVSYMTNPEAEHTVIMNNGWESDDPTWHVEERDWYVQTLKSKNGFSISSPYKDSQTGSYCITFSQTVYDTSKHFLGIFGIDFYMKSLINILSESYNNTGYAFLVDANGNIINHPNPLYQMNDKQVKNAFDSEYKDTYTNEMSVQTLTDYDGKFKACISEKDAVSGFTIIIVKDWWNMFGSIVWYSLLFLVMFGTCIVGVWVLLSKLIIWQAEVNAQLQEAAEKATSAGKAKSQFLAQMSHEIRTPINAVLGMNELILRECQDQTIREYSADIQSAGRTLLSLINSILDFSKIEDNKMEIVPVDYDSASLVNDLVNMTSERSKAKNLEFNIKIDPNIPCRLYGDDVRLRQIIVNLLTNSVKYTEKGSVTLTMSVKEKADEKIQLYVSVSDTGIGIKEEDRDKLCLSFSRLDQERNHSIEGTGLGLSIVTKLLNMMGSELQIESEYGKGSNFFFIIEQGIASAEPIGDYEKRKMIADASNDSENTLYAPKADILAVDDNEMNLKVVRGLLRRCGIVPDTASSGMECLEKVKNKHYDVILLDHMMPVMDGIETRRQLSEKGILPADTKVIVLTANAIVGAKEMYLKSGFDDYLSKPIDATKLEERLEFYLPKSKIEAKEQVKEAPKEDAAPVEEATSSSETALIDTAVGLSYCAEDVEMYVEILEAYLEEGFDNIEKLDSFYGDKDWKNYSILAHAVKSTSRTIGAMSLGELAYSHELAGKAGDEATIDETYVDFLTLYQRVLDEVKAKIAEYKQ